MRPIRLARIAAEAEGVRLRGLLVRTATRAVLALVAAIFILGVLVFIHVAAWFGISDGLDLSPISTAAILGGVDLLVAIVLVLLASRSSPSRVELEAYQVRRRAIEGLGNALSLTQMALPALRLVSGFGRRRRRR